MAEQPQEFPARVTLGQDLNWNAPWVEVALRVELPFWLMIDNTTMAVEVAGHEFQVSILGDTFELHGSEISDSKGRVLYQGPIRKREQLSDAIQEVLCARPDLHFLWRKCKTVLKIITRCNEDVWTKATSEEAPIRPSVRFYMEELCRAHIPVINRLVQSYRLATYDHFAFEVAPWDVPYWTVERGGSMKLSVLVRYREWDHRPLTARLPDRRPQFYSLVEPDQLREQINRKASPGEFELLDAINLMERGNYSDAVRRITTAIEVVVEAKVYELIETQQGQQAAVKFLSDTRMSFPRRVAKYEALVGRTLSSGLRSEMDRTRKLRHRIVHGGYRIDAGERGCAQRAVDTGRWMFNWFENDDQRRATRETGLAYRGLGRDLVSGIFSPKITEDGVVLSPL